MVQGRSTTLQNQHPCHFLQLNLDAKAYSKEKNINTHTTEVHELWKDRVRSVKETSLDWIEHLKTL